MFKTILNLPQNIIAYVKSTLYELRKVEWLKFGKVIRYTVIIIAVTILVTFLIMGLDAIFTAIRNWLIAL